LNKDFKKGFWVGLGVAAALIVASLAVGLVRM
jgi:hypothetical protein